MKVLLFVLLAGYAVKCDENNYYVIEMLDELPTPKPFKVYWNVPTKQCKSKKIPFDNLYEKFGIIQNRDDHFQGEKVTILYDPGLFPALLKNETSGRFKFRNGGVPQEGDLNKHLEAFKAELDQSIPDKEFDGIGIIDFESWRPVYRQNFGVLRPYKDVSLEIERKLHWWWQKKWLEAEAKRRFEESARTFMQSTIAVARRLRPLAQWGFYGFPYCFNMASNNMVEECAANVPQENDNISWLWKESTALYPSVYSSVQLEAYELEALVRGRVREAARFGRRILPYFWYRYRDAGFLSQVDLNAALDTLYKSNASGIIIWGSSSDVSTVQKCTKLLNYIEQVMGPAIAKYTKPRSVTTVSDDDTTKIAVGSTSNDVTTTSNIIKYLDPEYHWIPPDNYTQDIKDHVAEEINKKLNNYTGTDDKNTAFDNSVLIDLILNSVLNSNVSYNEENTTISNSKPTKQGENNDTLDESQSNTTTQANKELNTEITSVKNNTVTNSVLNNVSYSEENTNTSNSKLEENNDTLDESVSNINTQAKNDSNIKITSVKNNAVTLVDKETELEIILTTESTKLFDVTSNAPVDDKTSQNNIFISEEVTEYSTASKSLEKNTDYTTTDTSRSKNSKKTSLQDNIEDDYFDATTEISSSTETESDNSITVVTESTTELSEITTEKHFYDSKEASTTEVLETYISNIDTTTDYTAITQKSLVKNSRIDEVTLSPNINDIKNQTPSQETIQEAENEIENNSSTTEMFFNTKFISERNTTTKGPDLKETNKIELDTKENSENNENLSTKPPDMLDVTDIENNLSTKETQKLEDTSLAPSSTSPEQVSGSAPRITRSQSLYCIIFYIYSITKCLCSIFGQCT